MYNTPMTNALTELQALFGGAFGGQSASASYRYLKDDLDFITWNTGAGASGGTTWTTSGGAFTWAQEPGDHFGVIKLPKTNNAGLIGNQDTTSGSGVAFAALQKAVARFVVLPDNSPEVANNEWWCGFFNSFTNQQFGALFSAAQGFTNLPNANGVAGFVNPATGLIAATYNSVSGGNLGYIQTGLQPVANQWLDLIVVWTPVANRFYAAVYGNTPVLVATITNNICSNQSIYPAIFNASANTNLYCDRIEVIWQSTNAKQWMGEGLLNL